MILELSLITGVSPVQIDVFASSEEKFRVWDGWVHSRVRQLVMKVKSACHTVISISKTRPESRTYVAILPFC